MGVLMSIDKKRFVKELVIAIIKGVVIGIVVFLIIKVWGK